MQIDRLSILLLFEASMIFSILLGYCPSWCRQILVGVNGEVESMKRSVSLLGRVMCGRSRELEG